LRPTADTHRNAELRSCILHASPLLLKAAKRLEPLNLDLARETYLSAWVAALFAGRLAGAGDLLEVCRAARALPSPAEPPRTVDLVLDGLTLIVTDGPAAAGPVLRRAVSTVVDAEITAEEAFRWGWLAQAAASVLWDDDAWRVLLLRQVGFAREAGALDELPVMLGALGTALVWSGDFTADSALIVEADAICEVTGSLAAPFTAMLLASLRGRDAEAVPLIEATIAAAEAGGQGIAVAYAQWAAAILHNGLGHYQEALAAAQRASEDTYTLHISMWALPELVEAAAHSGNTRLATGAAERLEEFRLGRDRRRRTLAARVSTLLHDVSSWWSGSRQRAESSRARGHRSQSFARAEPQNCAVSVRYDLEEGEHLVPAGHLLRFAGEPALHLRELHAVAGVVRRP
jgi:hypothetical protein